MKQMFKRGFTLIELLVVIAIIGILASVVLASLNTARDKGEDAQIKANLNGVRAQAELFYDDNSSAYTSGTAIMTSVETCATALVASADAGTANAELMGNSSFFNAVNGAATTGGFCSVVYNADMYAVAVVLSSDDTTAWCVDSFGVSEELGHTAAYTQVALTGDLSIAGGCGS